MRVAGCRSGFAIALRQLGVVQIVAEDGDPHAKLILLGIENKFDDASLEWNRARRSP